MNKELFRQLGAEFLGTFALVFFGCGAIITLKTMGSDAGSGAVHIGTCLAFGFIVMGLIYSLGHISGGHFNPAVSLGLAAARRFAWAKVPFYWIAQVLGAIAASGMHKAIFADYAVNANFGATMPASGVLNGSAIGMEILLTFFFVMVINSVATDKRVNNAVGGLAIGFTLIVCAIFGGPITGASLNPARSLGPAIFAGSDALHIVWIYIAGPMVGAILGALAYEMVRGEESRPVRGELAEGMEHGVVNLQPEGQHQI